MHFRSITAKLLFLIIGTYIITLLSILFIADKQLNKILDKSQTEIYHEKLELIWSELDRTEQRLQKTGLVEANVDDFQNSVLSQFRKAYYSEDELTVYPFIVDHEFKVILHPTVPKDSDLLDQYNWTELMPAPHQGQFTTQFMGVDKWYIYQEFAPWGWLVCYTVPVSEKYRDARSFISMLLVVMLMFMILILPVLTILLVNFIKPVVRLTEISQKMAEGELDHHIAITSRDEIGVLAQSFKNMQSSIKQKLEDLNHENTERKKIEGELQKARNYIVSVIESMPSVLIGIDTEGIVTQWNSRAVELTKIPSSSAVGQPLDQIFPFPDIDLLSILSGIQKGIVQFYPQQVRSEGDMVNYDDITIYPLKSIDEQGAVIRIDDVTDKTLLEEQLVQAQKMDAIGQLAGGIAHDFNNMLAGITGAASLLQTMIDSKDDKSVKYLNLILDASSKAADLTSKLLTFGRKDSISSTSVNIHEIINGTLALLERTLDRRIIIHCENTADKPIFSGDYSTIQNALMNLAINSSHAMKDGGVLTVSTRNLFFDEYYCRVSPFNLLPGEFIDLAVSDTGVGIPPDSLGKIFEPFYTTKEHGTGTGLGLSSVYGAMQNHKGAVKVESELGNGTVFHLYLPCSKQEIRVQIHKESALKKGSGTILLIDDEEIIRLTAEPLLKKMGYNVLLARDGIEGLEVYKKEQSHISIVLSDMIMPRMNGKDLFYKIREINPTCLFVISSGFTKDENLSEMRADGLSGFIQKPFLTEELGKLLDEILH
ncbi:MULTISPECIES: ATP-binding protein [unclassified Oceanispirochaeta]|uniref:hybrid sensor histidine kinase/response regulator n=1 Tax=unclassified Oceanispirochaeta TaxID=2635722 RepID=UPI000E098034|nr:ATP-binding protein [Oceanispirochaeta sp. M1]MBF9017930.1 response regulator [Oceanispirochaeta sp. M2]NPD74441.1 response regulator [Oceanispirochaeta sp. M1]RDG29742.1 response regulator [Oceanispirochaeta sp. M1]